VDAVRDYIDSTLGDSSDNSYFEVSTRHALGLPEPATAEGDTGTADPARGSVQASRRVPTGTEGVGSASRIVDQGDLSVGATALASSSPTR
jgi:hypothetical protein